MPAAQLETHFTLMGFEEVALETHESDLIFHGGSQQAYETVFATPIGPRLRAFSEQAQSSFRKAVVMALAEMTQDGVTTGKMVSNVLVARRPGGQRN